MSVRPMVGVCEDDHELRGIIRSALERHGYQVRTTSSAGEAVAAFGANPPDLLVLDIGLPDADGRDVCQALRARGHQMPVLFVTARDALTDRLSGFHAGGDDYVTKPFALAELVVRVEALLKRAPPRSAPAAAGGRAPASGDPRDSHPLVLDPANHGIAGDPPVALTPTEFRVIGELAARRGKVVRRLELVRAGWPGGAIVSENTLDAYVSRIRSKLRQAGRDEEIANIRGVGYVLK